jgi:hypothetical protein
MADWSFQSFKLVNKHRRSDLNGCACGEIEANTAGAQARTRKTSFSCHLAATFLMGDLARGCKAADLQIFEEQV